MASVQITSAINIELDQLLDGVAQLETTDLEKFVEQVALILAQRKATRLHQSESDLLEQISQGIPDSTQQRYVELSAKLRDQTITPDEHQEFLALIDIVEQADADRLQHLVELSRLRQVSLNDLMNQLGIHPPAVHA
jgi:hypothetical protein